MKIHFGFHVSIAGGISKAFIQANALGISTFQIFTRSSRGWSYKPLDRKEISSFLELRQNFFKIVCHLPYLPNLASPDEITYKKSLDSLLEEVKRCDLLQINYLVAHLGSHKGSGKKNGIEKVVSMLNKTLEMNPKVTILLENTAGTRNSVGSEFEDIGIIIDSTSDPTKIGVCFDTCHAFAAGYDLRTPNSIEKTLEHFDHAIGLSRIKTIHCNDSKGDLGCSTDRHEHIGLGYIGLKGFKVLFEKDIFHSCPVILETPIDDTRDDYENLEVVKSLEPNNGNKSIT
ncbi:MAG: deoxyribonuclease IV [Candidatus Thorarchaeota archaeon]